MIGPMSPPTTRFAPSPSGMLHVGNVRTALFSLLAALPDGRFLLRIEDTDRTRVAPRFVEAALFDLDWLGFGTFIDRSAILYQSARTAIYDDYIGRLEVAKRAYPCFCSQAALALDRAQAQAQGRPPRYSGRCAKLDPIEAKERLARGESAVWRFRVPPKKELRFEDTVRGPQVVASDLLGDFVVRRANGEPMFFFTNALDDALSGVTWVLRGEGFLPEAIVNYLARLGAVVASDALLTLPDLAAAFDPTRIGHAPARYDRQQLLHWQRLAMAQAPLAALLPWVPREVPTTDRVRFVETVRANSLFPQEFALWAEILYGENEVPTAEALQAVRRVDARLFDQALALLAEGRAPEDLAAGLKAFGFSGKVLFHALRAALTGRLTGPELKGILGLMPRPVLVRRLARFGTSHAQNL